MQVQKYCEAFFDTELPRLVKDSKGMDQPISLPNVLSLILERGADAQAVNLELFIALQQARHRPITMWQLITVLRDEYTDLVSPSLVETMRALLFAEFEASFQKLMRDRLTAVELEALATEARRADCEKWEDYVSAYLRKVVTGP